MKANATEELPLGARRGISQFTPPIGRASSDRTYPGGLPRFDRTSSHSPPALTTLSRVPLPICEITRAVEDAFAAGQPVPFEVLMRSGGAICPWLASVTFGGTDLKTVHLGGLRSTNIPTFASPVAGLPMVHW